MKWMWIAVLAGCGTSHGAPIDGRSIDSSSGGSGFCAPCVESSDCTATAGLCLGQTGNCGVDCSGGQACPNGSTCQAVTLGMSPPLGQQCVPTVAACGDLTAMPNIDCADGWTGYANTFFAQTCRGCHTSGYDSALAINDSAAAVRLAIERGDMPVGSTLSSTDRRRILTWLACQVHGSAPPTQ